MLTALFSCLIMTSLSMQRGKLEEEHRVLTALITDLQDILTNKKRVLDVRARNFIHVHVLWQPVAILMFAGKRRLIVSRQKMSVENAAKFEVVSLYCICRCFQVPYCLRAAPGRCTGYDGGRLGLRKWCVCMLMLISGMKNCCG
jgi:hypothetical protein